jgi:hypothetical protein
LITSQHYLQRYHDRILRDPPADECFHSWKRRAPVEWHCRVVSTSFPLLHLIEESGRNGSAHRAALLHTVTSMPIAAEQEFISEHTLLFQALAYAKTNGASGNRHPSPRNME